MSVPAIDPSTLPGPAQKILDPAGPAPLKAMAAKGLMPGLGPGAILAVIVALSLLNDANGEQARKTLEKLPVPLLNGALALQDLHPAVLDALGPIYARDGVLPLGQQIRFTIDGMPPDGGSDAGIRPFEAGNLEDLLALDRYATGEDREAVLRSSGSPATTFVALDPANIVRAYLARAPWRGGALIALEPDDALALLEIRRHSTGISGMAGAGVLASNSVGRERLRAAGWLEERGGVRMIRGEPLDWHPDAIWGQLNGALG